MSAAQTFAFRLQGLEHGYRSHLGFKTHPVLRGVELELASGRTLALAGPNGSGKSTLLRILAGIERPWRGTLEVLAGSPLDARVRARVGYLPEDSPFPVELSARAALRLLGALQRVERDELDERAEQLLVRVGLGAAAKQRLGTFSRGMLRRFGLAQAWLHAPSLILLDEPTAGLDAQGFEVLSELLSAARERAASIVIASHIASDLTDHGDELAVLLAGRIAIQGKVREVLAGRGLLELYRSHQGVRHAP
jgi:ABC-2 type transport system ATP-binding protein